MTELGSTASWEEAKKIAALIGDVPPTFTTLVHFLRQDIAKNNGLLGPYSQYCLRRLLQAPGAKAPLYFAALTYVPQKVELYSRIESVTFTKFFTLEDLSLIVGLLYLYRRIRRGIDPNEWPALAKELMVRTDVGGLVGRAMPAIGIGAGLLVGASRHLGAAMFLGIDKAGFAKYRRRARAKGVALDVEDELATWGCTHVQIAAMLFQTMRLGVDIVDSLSRGLTFKYSEYLDASVLRINLALLWIESMLATYAPPDIVHKGQFYPLAKELAYLSDSVKKIRKEGSPYHWFDRGHLDISAEKTPALYGAEDEDGKAPPEIDQELSEEQRKSLVELDLDDS